ETPLESVYLGRSLSDASSSSSSLFYSNRTTLTSLTIGNSVKSLGNYAFSNCTGLTSVVIPNGLNTIGDYCFDSCSELKSLTLGSSLTIIGNSAFSSCAKLAVVTLPESLKTIGDSAFKGCSGLRLLNIPNSVTSVGSYAFDGCSGIRSITIGNSVESIGDYAFNGGSKFATITIPSSVSSIGNGVFNGCSGLKDLTIEDSEDILSLGTNGLGDGLFNDSPLENVYLGRDISCDNTPFKNKTTLTSLTIGYCVTTIDDATFSGCSGLKDLTIEYCDEVLSLGRNDEDEGLFYDCPLESLYLGRDLSYDISSEYGYSPFYNKESLSSLIVGSSVTAIGCGLFEECSGLTEIYSLSSEPAVCDVLPFWGVDKTIPVYIPFGSKSAYKSASEWKDFTNFIESEFTGVEGEVISTSDIKVISGNGIEVSDYYGRIRIVNLAGQVIKDVYVNGSIQISLPKGIYIVVTENNSQKVIL
ncbi:MAG: leucine-rich repeat protein, partial [Bacteroidales bacterium]|nr:leucine-rich repeat protein [Bacteroidales bacterium]